MREKVLVNKYRIRKGLYGSDDDLGNVGAFNIPFSEGGKA